MVCQAISKRIKDCLPQEHLCWKYFPRLSKQASLVSLMLSQMFMSFQFGALPPTFSREAHKNWYSTILVGVFLAFVPFFKLTNRNLYDLMALSKCRKLPVRRLIVVFVFLSAFTHLSLGWSCFKSFGVIIPFGLNVLTGFWCAITGIASKRLVDKVILERKSWLKTGAKVGYVMGPVFVAAFGIIEGLCILLFFGSATLLFLVDVIMLIFLPNMVEDEAQSKNYFRLLKEPKDFGIFMTAILAGMSSEYLNPIVWFHASKMYDLPKWIMGLLSAEWNFLGFFMPYILTKLFKRLQGFYHAPLLVGLFGSGLLFLFLAPSPLLSSIFQDNILVKDAFIAVAALMGLFKPMVWIFQKKNKEEIEDNAEAKKLASLLKRGTLIGEILGLILAGVLAETVGFPWAATVMALLLLLGAIIWTISLIIIKCHARPASTRDTDDYTLKGSSSDIQVVTTDNRSSPYSPIIGVAEFQH